MARRKTQVREGGLQRALLTYVEAREPGSTLTTDGLHNRFDRWARGSISGAMGKAIELGLVDRVGKGVWLRRGKHAPVEAREVIVQDAVVMRDGTIIVQINGELYEAVKSS